MQKAPAKTNSIMLQLKLYVAHQKNCKQVREPENKASCKYKLVDAFRLIMITSCTTSFHL